MFFTIPTLLTWTRIIAIPLMVGVYSMDWPQNTQNNWATALFVVFAFTDWLDGYMARKLKQTSSFGAFLDPVADKFLVAASLLVLLSLGRVGVLVTLIIIGREIAVSALREWMAQIGASAHVAVHMVGKVKTSVQMLAIPFLLYNQTVLGWFDSARIGEVLIWVAAILTIWSMVFYVVQALPSIRQHASTEADVLPPKALD